MSTKDSVHEIVTEKIVAALEQGTVPWRKPWNARTGGPANIDGYRYRGINVWLLLMESMQHGYTSPYWMTFKQAKAKGGSVRKGEKSTVIVFWKKLMINEKDEATGKVTKKSIPMLRYYRVFNLEQTEGVRLPAKVAEAMNAEPIEHDPIEDAEAIVTGWTDGPSIDRTGTAAFYSPVADAITVPPLSDFNDPTEFYSTLFHEMTHSTGHKSRHDRFTGKNAMFGSHDYGREELIAEMGAAFLCAEAGIETTIPNSAAYLASWIKTIKEDVRAVVVAAGAAQRAADLIMGRTWDKAETDDDTPTTQAAVAKAA